MFDSSCERCVRLYAPSLVTIHWSGVGRVSIQGSIQNTKTKSPSGRLNRHLPSQRANPWPVNVNYQRPLASTRMQVHGASIGEGAAPIHMNSADASVSNPTGRSADRSSGSLSCFRSCSYR